jgi:hypothetical protein
VVILTIAITRIENGGYITARAQKVTSIRGYWWALHTNSWCDLLFNFVLR